MTSLTSFFFYFYQCSQIHTSITASHTDLLSNDTQLQKAQRLESGIPIIIKADVELLKDQTGVAPVHKVLKPAHNVALVRVQGLDYFQHRNL